MRQGWRVRTVLSEAFSNVASSLGRSILLGVALSASLGALVWWELAYSEQVKDEAARYSEAGGYVVVMSGPQGVDGSRCATLAQAPDVVAAGAVRGVGLVSTAHAPSVSFQKLEVTTGAVLVWDPEAEIPTEGGLLIGEAAAVELGLVTGSWIVAVGDQPTRSLVVDPSSRNRFAARSFLDLVAPFGRFDQCWIEVLPGAFNVRLQALPASVAPDEVEARPLVDRGDFGPDPALAFAGRIQQWGWIPAGIVGTSMIALLALSRRAETAVYRAFGLSRPAVMVMQQAEVAMLVLASLVVGGIWAVLLHAATAQPPDLDQLAIATATATKAAALTVVLGPVISTAVAAGSPSSLLRDR